MPTKRTTNRTNRTAANAAATAQLKFTPSVEMWPIGQVLPYPLNTKQHPEEQIAQVAAAIQEFGWDVPIVVDEVGVIIKGHCRRLAAARLGLPEVPVVVRRDLSEAQKKAARISDNKIAESDWDMESLKVEMEALGELGFNLDLTGFDTLELGDLFLESCPEPDRVSSNQEADEMEFQPPERIPGSAAATSDEDDEPGESDDEPEERAVSSVRMVQLFLDNETQPEFLELVEFLNAHFTTENATDCVMAALREAHERYSG